MNILNAITHKQVKFSKAELKVIGIILKNLEQIPNMAIARLAQLSDVSEPTVNRLSHKLGCVGYPDLKVKLAAEIALSSTRLNQSVELGDNTQLVIQKIFASNHANLDLSEQQCSKQIINRVASLITNARAVYFFGQGSSAAVAIDAQQKFIRFDFPVIAETDHLSQTVIAAGASKKDVIICISYSGRTSSIVEVAKLASQTDASIIGITQNNSPLAKHCQQTIHVEVQEDTDLFTPMASRIAHLVTIDILATVIAVQIGDKLSAHLAKIKNAVRSTKLPD